jgi:quercetin dioxygenase-like cupin family protein
MHGQVVCSSGKLDHAISEVSQESVVNGFAQNRRLFLASAGGFGMSQLLGQDAAKAQGAPQGNVLGPGGGEHLVHFRDQGNIYIKFGAATGSEGLAMGTQQVTAGAGIPTHRHLQMDEAFYVLDGSGIVMLNEVRHPFEKGSTIFIPRNSWHGFENPEREVLLLWIMAPAGLDGFFRETCSAAGAPPKQLTREKIREIAWKYGTEFR